LVNSPVSPIVSVVMLSFNRRDDVAEGLQKLLEQDYPKLDIWVVDNGSNDHTTTMIHEKYPQVNLIALEKNIGVAAYNLGFQKAIGEYIVILDDDSFPEKKAITRMVEEFRNNDQLGVVAFDVRNYYDYQKKEPHPVNTPPVNQPTCRYQMAFNGAGVGIRKKCLIEVGGYPEEFFLYWNEQDLAIRILDAGYQIQWFTDIVSLHKYAPSNRESLRAPFYYTRNLYWLIWKYFPPVKLIADTLKMFFYSLYYTFEQKTMIYLRATLDALIHLGRIKRKPAKKIVIQQLRLTYRLSFIYYK